MATVLLEIGTEEMPAAYLPPVLAQLREMAQVRLTAERLIFDEITTWGTPRRIALYVTGMAEQQAPAAREVRGPTVAAAFTMSGEPTQAATGFARSFGLSVNDLRIKTIDNEEYVVAIFHDENRSSAELLPALFNELIGNLTFPHTMRWGSGAFRFARPIRWIVALMDAQVIPVIIDGVAAGHHTRGHRFLSPSEVEVPTAETYRQVMEDNLVMVDHLERRETIRAQIEAIARQEEAVVVDDGALLDAATFHVEYPTAVRCAFDAHFLSLPAEVLHLVLRREQEFFPLTTQSAALLPVFIGVRNGDKAYLNSVRDGYESVARAKLTDALFFFEQDQRIPLEDRLEALRGVIFLERLGTMYEKVGRIQALAGAVAAWLNFTEVEQELLQRAAWLSKSDLVTAMVTEHPELQGIMGGVYARHSGEVEQVAEAISAQYRPRSPAECIPNTPLGSMLALADKLDTVSASFVAGVTLTGTEDLYGVYRDAQGVVRILAEGDYPLALSRLIKQALLPLLQALPQAQDELQFDIANIFRQQVENFLSNTGIPGHIARAVTAVSVDIPAYVLRRARVLCNHQHEPAFASVIHAAIRLSNISKHFPGGEICAELLREPSEQRLYTAYREHAHVAESLAEQGDYSALFALLADIIPAVDHFFAETLVMVEEPELRQNRLALVWCVANLYRLFGDLTLVVPYQVNSGQVMSE